MRYLIVFAVLAGCSALPEAWRPDRQSPSAEALSGTQSADGAAAAQRPVARPGAAPMSEDADVPAPDRPPATPGALGTTVASLGSPAEAGLWLKTPLVSAQQAGNISYKGKTIAVTLIPIDGPDTAGSRMSLQAFQALGAALTDLVEVSVSV